MAVTPVWWNDNGARPGIAFSKVLPLSLHIHHGPHLGPLVEILAGTLAAPVADPFTADVVSVPTAGMRDWLQQQLGFRLGATGHRDGIAANIDMVFPGRFTAAALGRPLGETSPWDIERLTWTVLDALESDDVDVPGWRTRRNGTYARARRIADLFDRYAINRPQLLQQWQAGHDGDGTTDENEAIVPLADDHAWQPRLWRVVRAAIGPNPSEHLPDLLTMLRSGTLEPQLPERVSVFGVSGVSAAQLDILQALGAVRDVHLHLVHPSPAAWAGSRQQLAGRLVLRGSCDATAAIRHPLLRSWGRPAMEAAVLVNGLAATIDVALDARHHEPPLTLLHQIQADLVDDVDRSTSKLSYPSSRRVADTSLQIHACHGTVRQLEVLRDALGHLFAADHSLTAHDVVVLCPDLARFAPLARSVFQRSSLPIPVRVTDLSLGVGNPVAIALSTVLEVIGGRCTGPDVLSVCSLDPVRRAFGFDDEGIERIDRWMTDLGVSWGLDGDHRSRWISEDITEGTWASTLDRILLGAAMPAPTPRVGPSEIVPFDDIDAAALVTAGQLGDVLDQLDHLRRVTAEAHPIDEWVVMLTDVVNSLFVTTPADAWQTIQVMETIAEIGRHAAGGTGGTFGSGDTFGSGATESSSVPLALNDIRSLLGGVLDEQRGRLNLRSGAVTVTAMVPVRNIPARVVCVLGLEEGTLRGTGADGDDVLSARPCVGERDPRTEGRHLLLDALMSAGDHFMITCDGSDITTNRPVPVPVLIEELLDVVRCTLPPDHDPRVALIRRHPRQAFDDRNFGVDATGTSDEPFSFDAGMLRAAELRRELASGPGPASGPASGPEPARWSSEPVTLPLLGPLIPSAVTIAQLADAPTRPARTYLTQRLDVRLPRPVEEVETDIPLVLGSLQSWQLADELLDQYRRGVGDDALQEWRDAQRHSGALPPRALARAVVSDIERDLGVLLKARSNMRELLTATGSHDVDVQLNTPDGGPLVRLCESVDRIAGDLLVRVQYTRPKYRQQITMALELAALVLDAPDRDWSGVLVTRNASAGSQIVNLRPVDGPERIPSARRLLETTLAIHLRALREPVPMFDKSSKALFESGNFDDEEFTRSDLRDNHTGFIWGETTADEVLAIRVRSDDELEPLLTIAATTACTGGGRAHALALYFWSAYASFVGAPK